MSSQIMISGMDQPYLLMTYADEPILLDDDIRADEPDLTDDDIPDMGNI